MYHDSLEIYKNVLSKLNSVATSRPDFLGQPVGLENST